MSTSTPHCRVNYHGFNGTDLDTLAHLVAEGIYSTGSPFSTPPITKTVYEELVSVFHEKYEAYKNGGKAQKGPYETARENLIEALDTLVEYVDGLPGLTDAIIETAGFVPAKSGQSATVPPTTPTGVVMEQGASGEIITYSDAQPGDNSYGCFFTSYTPMPEGFGINNAGQIIIVNDKPVPAPPPGADPSADGPRTIIIDLNKSRKKRFSGLIKGVEYFACYWASNTAGVSQLSEVKSFICN